MERLNRVQLVVDEHLDHVLLPAKNVVELVPGIIVLPEIEHGIDVEIDFEVPVVPEAGK